MTNDNSLNFYSIFKWVIIISFVVYAVFPFLWLVLASLKTNAELLDNPFKLPKVFQFQNPASNEPNEFSQAGLESIGGDSSLDSEVKIFYQTYDSLKKAGIKKTKGKWIT